MDCKYNCIKQYCKSKVLLSLIFKIVSDVKRFYAHWYHNPGDLIDLAVMLIFQNNYNIDELCASYFNGESGFLWICCPHSVVSQN